MCRCWCYMTRETKAGFGFRVSGFGFRVSGLVFRYKCRCGNYTTADSVRPDDAPLNFGALLHREQLPQQGDRGELGDGRQHFHKHKFHVAARTRNGNHKRIAVFLSYLFHRIQAPVIGPDGLLRKFGQQVGYEAISLRSQVLEGFRKRSALFHDVQQLAVIRKTKR